MTEHNQTEHPQKVHPLKTWPAPFKALWDGDKLFEYRRNDRGFKVGDILSLEEWDPTVPVRFPGVGGGTVKGAFSGRKVMADVTYIAYGAFGIPADFCCMSIRVREKLEAA